VVAGSVVSRDDNREKRERERRGKGGKGYQQSRYRRWTNYNWKRGRRYVLKRPAKPVCAKGGTWEGGKWNKENTAHLDGPHNGWLYKNNNVGSKEILEEDWKCLPDSLEWESNQEKRV